MSFSYRYPTPSMNASAADDRFSGQTAGFWGKGGLNLEGINPLMGIDERKNLESIAPDRLGADQHRGNSSQQSGRYRLSCT